jgi:ferredoxin
MTTRHSKAVKVPAVVAAVLSLIAITCSHVSAWSTPNQPRSSLSISSPLFAAVSSKGTSGQYDPKWKKKGTLAEEQGSVADLGFQNVGLKGTIQVTFRQGNVTKTSMAWAGQPLRDVATQAGQFIKYGCGKGECGTCECLVNGQWIRPCTALLPADAGAADAPAYVIQIKEIKAVAASSGKFFSFRSFIMGFWNNLLGMVGFVKTRKAARKNWQERQEYEDLVAQRTRERKSAKQRAEQGGSAGAATS